MKIFLLGGTAGAAFILCYMPCSCFNNRVICFKETIKTKIRKEKIHN